MNLTEILLEAKVPIRELSDTESSKLKQTLLDIYLDIYNVCEQNHLACFLGGGSCLGAVRHGGFIPWDDDLDLNMPRSDYNKFPALLLAAFPNKYHIVGAGFSKTTPYNYIKIEKIGTRLETIFDNAEDSNGIGIDIFPLEEMPKGKIHNFLHGTLLNALFFIAICTKLYQKPSIVDHYLSLTRKGRQKIFLRKTIGFLFSWKSYSSWNTYGDHLASKCYHSKFCTFPSGRKHYFGEKQSIDTFFPLQKATFEGLPCYLPAKYDTYLTSLYGNYMEIPPVEKREKHFIINIKF